MDIVESCEITATVAPSAEWNCSGEKQDWYVMLYSLTWPPFVYKDVTVVVLSIFSIIFCVYSVIFSIKMVELCTLAWTYIVSGNVYSTICRLNCIFRLAGYGIHTACDSQLFCQQLADVLDQLVTESTYSVSLEKLSANVDQLCVVLMLKCRCACRVGCNRPIQCRPNCNKSTVHSECAICVFN